MHRQFKDQGLVVISVTVDDPEDDEAIKGAKEFLVSQKAVFTNFLLDESVDFWTEKLDIVGVPCVYVFNRAGQIEEKYTEKPDDEVFDGLVKKLLQQKGP